MCVIVIELSAFKTASTYSSPTAKIAATKSLAFDPPTVTVEYVTTVDEPGCVTCIVKLPVLTAPEPTTSPVALTAPATFLTLGLYPP